MANLKLRVEAEDSGSRVLDDVAKKLAVVEAKGRVVGDTLQKAGRSAAEGLENTGKSATKAGEKLDDLGKVVKDLKQQFATLVSFEAVRRFFAAAAEEALSEAEALRKVTFAVKATDAALQDATQTIEGFAKAQQETTRFSDSVTLDTLGRLISVTGSLEQAIAATTLAQNIAAGSQLNLAESTELVAGLVSGQSRSITTARKELGAYVEGAKTTQEIVDKLSESFKGAAANEKSFTKSFAQSRAFLDDFLQRVGEGILPIISGAVKSVAFLAASFEVAGVRIAGKAAIIIETIKALGKAAAAPFGGAGALAKAEAEYNASIKAIVEQTNRDIADITKRFTNESTNTYLENLRIRAKATEEAARLALEAIEKEKKARQEFADIEQRYRVEKLERETESLDSKLELIRIETEAEVENIRKKGAAAKASAEKIKELEDEARAKGAERRRQAEADFDAVGKAGEEAARQIKEGFAQAYANTLVTGEDFGKQMDALFTRILTNLVSKIIESGITEALAGIFKATATGGASAAGGAGGGGGFFSGIIGGLLGGGGFKHGTQRVPGPVGAPRVALVHGGEEVRAFGARSVDGVREEDAEEQIVVQGAREEDRTTRVGIQVSPAMPAARGSDGGPTIFNISVNLAVADLSPSEREKVVRALTDEVRAATEAAREFSGQLSILSDRNAGRAT